MNPSSTTDPTPAPAPSHHDAETIDYRESEDITEMHAAILRERPEPGPIGGAPVPLWLVLLAGVALFCAGMYLGLFHGGFRGDVFNARSSSPALLFPTKVKPGAEVVAEEKPKSLAEEGKRHYVANCQTCHQPTGQGLFPAFPPLAGSEWATGSPKRVAAILLKGLQGPITVEGKQYNGAMPAWEATLNDRKLAAIASYIRQEWGNKASEITPEQFAAARKEFASRTQPWTAAEIEKIPADAQLEGAAPAKPAAAPGASAPAPAATAPAPAQPPPAVAK